MSESSTSNYSIQIAYIHGRIEAQLEGFAVSIGIPTRQLTERVAALLLGTQSGEILGTQDRMPILRPKAKRRKAPPKVEVAKRASHKSHLTKAQLAAMRKNVAKARAALLAKKRNK